MNFLKNNIWTICLVALFCVFGFAGEAAATGGGSSVVGKATDKARNVFASVKTILFVVGGFGLGCFGLVGCWCCWVGVGCVGCCC